MVDSPAVATAGICRQQGGQEVCKRPCASLLIGYAKLVQGLHQGRHHFHTHSVALITQQVQEGPACTDCVIA